MIITKSKKVKNDQEEPLVLEALETKQTKPK